MTEEKFLNDLFCRLIYGNKVEKFVARLINEEARWASPGSTIKIKKIVADQICNIYTSQHPDFNSVEKRELLTQTLNEIIEFQSQPYERGDGSA